MNSEGNSDNYSNWNRVLYLDCSTQKNIDIVSYGDWCFSLYQRDANKVDRPMYEIMKERKIQADYYGQVDQDFQFDMYEYPNLNNAKQAFNNLSVEVNISQGQFRVLYGFWQIEEFKVYDRDGNFAACSFRTKDKFYYGLYCTS